MEELYSRDFSPYEQQIKTRAIEAFKDDLGAGDITSDAVLEDVPARAVVIAEEKCLLAGVLEAKAILDNGGVTLIGKGDGENVTKGEEIFVLEGSLKEILARERLVLNYITRMSGIATLSRKLSKKHGKKILFLRKTDPGLLFSEKRAVALGGCLPHRINLADGILIKDNHINQLAKSSDRILAIEEAIMRADEYRTGKKSLPIEIEVESVEEAQTAAKKFKGIPGPNILLLDNMPHKQVKKAVSAVRLIGDTIIEASGGITEKNIKDYLKAGADYVSTSLFVSAKPCKFKLEMI